MRFPAFMFWPERYWLDTYDLSDAEHGRYLRVLILMWNTPNCRIPNDPEWIAAKTGRSLQAFENEIKPILLRFCKTDGNSWWQSKLLAEYQRCERLHNRGTAGGKALAKKKKESSQTHARDQKQAYAPTPTPTPTPKESLVLACEDDIDKAFQSFNETAQKCGLPRAAKLTAARKAKLKARLNGHGLSLWLEALGKIEASPFLRGENKNGWRADLDFMLQESSFNKLVEGSYDRPNANVVPEQSAPRSPPPRSSRHELRDADG